MDGTIVCAGTIGFFFLLFAFILAMRYLNYRETLMLAEKGLVKPPRERNGSCNGGSKAALVWGVILAAIGLALMLGLWPLGFTSVGRGFMFGFGPWMLFGLLPLFFGLALVLVYVLTRPAVEKKPESGSLPELPDEPSLPASVDPEAAAGRLPPQN
jgi:hypothetical protein